MDAKNIVPPADDAADRVPELDVNETLDVAEKPIVWQYATKSVELTWTMLPSNMAEFLTLTEPNVGFDPIAYTTFCVAAAVDAWMMDVFVVDESPDMDA